jgi:MoaA/NifB/PqqE/SkfB family radical SAM enzyme
MSRLSRYLEDPDLGRMYQLVRAAGAVRPISLDLTSKCNLRCTGCYYYAEGMDQVDHRRDDDAFDALIESEQARGTNFVTVVGGEPALEPGRLRKLYRHFKMNVATNGLIPIPREGLENMPMGIAVWGSRETDARLRGQPGKDLLSTALENYRGDPRAFFYYTVAPGHAHEIEDVVGQIVENGNKVLFNYYSDVSERGGELGYAQGFGAVRREVDRMIDRYPDMMYTTPYLNRVTTRGELMGQRWGYDVCTNLTVDNEINTHRQQTGKPYNPHFRAINADFKTTRRCCTGSTRDCASCFDTWEHFSWIMINMRKHLGNRREFTDWLSTMFAFYVVNRLVDPGEGHELLARVQARWSAGAPRQRTA